MKKPRLTFLLSLLLATLQTTNTTVAAIGQTAPTSIMELRSAQKPDFDSKSTLRDGLNPVQYFYLAQLYINHYEIKKAQICRDKLREGQSSAESRLYLKVLETSLLPTQMPAQQAMELFAKAKASFSERSKARELLETCIKVYPQFEYPYLLLARLESIEQHPDKASELRVKVLSINPRNSIALSDLCTSALSGTEIAGACTYLKRLKECNPYFDNPSLRLIEMRCQQEAQESKAAKSSVNDLMQREPAKLGAGLPPIGASRNGGPQNGPPTPNFEMPTNQSPPLPLSLSQLTSQTSTEPGFIDKTGKTAFEIGPNVVVGEHFSDGLLIVNASEGRGINCGNGHTQYWNTDGDLGIDRSFEDGKSSSEGFCAIQSERRWGFADHSGKVVVPCKFLDADQFHDGLAAVKTESGWGFINKGGLLVTEPMYDDCLAFSDGLAAISLGEKLGFINKDGVLVTPLKYLSARSFSDGLAYVSFAENGKAITDCFIDKTGKVIIDLKKLRNKFGSAEFNLPPSMMQDDDTLSPNRLRMLQGMFSRFRHDRPDFQENLLPIILGGKYAYLDSNGNVAIEPRFEEANQFSSGIACVKVDKKYGYIDKTGAFVIPANFTKAQSFSDGLAAVSSTGVRWGYIDTSGNQVIPEKFPDAKPFYNGIAKVFSEK